MSIVNLLKNDIWSEADIINAGRAAIYSQISFDRQQELQTIMLGHIAGMRTATMEELAEIAQVQAVTEAQASANAAARADMALLNDVLAYEAALDRLTCAVIDGPLMIESTGLNGLVSDIPNPAIAVDAEERDAAEAVINAASEETHVLYALRHPAPVEEVTE